MRGVTVAANRALISFSAFVIAMMYNPWNSGVLEKWNIGFDKRMMF
jgi:hypothetical protein